MNFSDFYSISIPTLIELAAKVACIVHLIKTGRSYMWFWVILLFPVGGVLIYFFVEIYPDLRGGRGFLGGGGGGGLGLGLSIKLPQTSARKIARLKDELEFANTIENRVQLAQAYSSAGRHDEAIETLNACLRGAFKDDPLLTYELARARFVAGQHREALAALQTLAAQGWRHDVAGRLLLTARGHEALGDDTGASIYYQEALKSASGEEARCRYALLLERRGQREPARAMFAETVDYSRRAGGRYRRLNREWIQIAKARLAALKAGA